MRRHRLLIEFEHREMARAPDPADSFRVYEAMVREAVELGVFPLADPLEGIEDDIELARKLKGIRRRPG